MSIFYSLGIRHVVWTVTYVTVHWVITVILYRQEQMIVMNVANHESFLIFYIMMGSAHDDVIKWKHFPRYWHFVRGIHRTLVNSPHKGQWRGDLMFSLICAWANDATPKQITTGGNALLLIIKNRRVGRNVQPLRADVGRNVKCRGP